METDERVDSALPSHVEGYPLDVRRVLKQSRLDLLLGRRAKCNAVG